MQALGQVIALVAQVVVAAVQCQAALVDAVHADILTSHAAQAATVEHRASGITVLQAADPATVRAAWIRQSRSSAFRVLASMGQPSSWNASRTGTKGVGFPLSYTTCQYFGGRRITPPALSADTPKPGGG